ncbi:MAG: prolyl aminopeptidase [Alphaproteobacteria bacterium]|nr:prolyl aminopeptidase [Alphaproteobacteria bacterium]
MSLYPEIEPYDHGLLEVGDGHRIYWEVCGNPAGKPAVVLHGGPGSGCGANARRYYDPAVYRLVLFDQRSVGRSLPHASEPGIDLSANTTEHLLQDIDRLRRHLGIERWLVFGGSWGSTLALAYAERHPGRVTEMILASIATTTPAEIDWIARGVGQFFPEAWERFRSGAPAGENLLDGYHRLLMSPDPAVAAKAAGDWCEWENAIVAVTPGHKPHPRWVDPKFRLGFARLVTHYWRHHAWLEDGILLRNIGRIAHVPAALIHGRLDFSCPLVNAWLLHKSWPASELTILGAAGHDGRDPGAGEALLAATDRFARR